MRTDVSRCPNCALRLIATIDENGRTELRCLKCDQIDPLKTVASCGRKVRSPTGWQRLVSGAARQ